MSWQDVLTSSLAHDSLLVLPSVKEHEQRRRDSVSQPRNCPQQVDAVAVNDAIEDEISIWDQHLQALSTEMELNNNVSEGLSRLRGAQSQYRPPASSKPDAHVVTESISQRYNRVNSKHEDKKIKMRPVKPTKQNSNVQPSPRSQVHRSHTHIKCLRTEPKMAVLGSSGKTKPETQNTSISDAEIGHNGEHSNAAASSQQPTKPDVPVASSTNNSTGCQIADNRLEEYMVSLIDSARDDVQQLQQLFDEDQDQTRAAWQAGVDAAARKRDELHSLVLHELGDLLGMPLLSRIAGEYTHLCAGVGVERQPLTSVEIQRHDSLMSVPSFAAQPPPIQPPPPQADISDWSNELYVPFRSVQPSHHPPEPIRRQSSITSNNSKHRSSVRSISKGSQYNEGALLSEWLESQLSSVGLQLEMFVPSSSPPPTPKQAVVELCEELKSVELQSIVSTVLPTVAVGFHELLRRIDEDCTELSEAGLVPVNEMLQQMQRVARATTETVAAETRAATKHSSSITQLREKHAHMKKRRDASGNEAKQLDRQLFRQKTWNVKLDAEEQWNVKAASRMAKNVQQLLHALKSAGLTHKHRGQNRMLLQPHNLHLITDMAHVLSIGRKPSTTPDAMELQRIQEEEAHRQELQFRGKSPATRKNTKRRNGNNDDDEIIDKTPHQKLYAAQRKLSWTLRRQAAVGADSGKPRLPYDESDNDELERHNVAVSVGALYREIEKLRWQLQEIPGEVHLATV